MDIYVVRCPNRKDYVRVAWVEVPAEERDAARPAAKDVLCLDAGHPSCGNMCHLFNTTAVRMEDRLRMFREPRPW